MFIIILSVIILAAVIIQTVVYRKHWDRNLFLSFRFSSPEAFEGDALYLYSEISNKKILPLPWLVVDYELSVNLLFPGELGLGTGEVIKTGLFSVMGYRRVRRKSRFVCSKRGYYRLRRIKLTGSNLLHTQTYAGETKSNAELTVFPKLLNHFDELNIILNSLDAMLLTHSLINPDPFTFKGLREYTPDDPLRNVNFKASAVAQQLMVNVYNPMSSKRLEIILNMEHNAPRINAELYEQAIRLAATVANHYISADVVVGLYSNGRDAVLGEQCGISPGTHQAQLYAVYQALGRLSLTFEPGHISAYLNTLQDGGCIYLLISPYWEDDLRDALVDMQARGLDIAAVIPVEKKTKIKNVPSQKIIPWEAV